MKLLESLFYLALMGIGALAFMVIADLIDKSRQRRKGVQPINGRIPDGPIARNAIWVLIVAVIVLFAAYGRPDTDRPYGCYGSMRC
jgi:hypothetical protein